MRTLPVIAALIAMLTLAAPAGAAVKRLQANPSGSAATDANGGGTAKLRLNRDRERVCYTITVRRIDDVVAVHIHRGGPRGRRDRGRPHHHARIRYSLHPLHEDVSKPLPGPIPLHPLPPPRHPPAAAPPPTLWEAPGA